MSDQPLQVQSEEVDTNPIQSSQILIAEATISPGKKSIIELSSTSQDSESCEAYFTRNMEALGAGDPITAETDDESSDLGKASVRVPVVVTPGPNNIEVPKSIREDAPAVTYLERPMPSFLSSSLL